MAKEQAPEISQADSLPQLAEFEKADPKKIDLATFIFRYRDSMVSIDCMTPDKYKTKTKLDLPVSVRQHYNK